MEQTTINLDDIEERSLEFLSLMDDGSLAQFFGIKTASCRYCDEPATKRNHFGQSAVINTCASHVGMAKQAVAKQGMRVTKVDDITEGKYLPAQDKLPKTETCGMTGCKEQATKRIIWADGRAYRASCDKHVGTLKQKLNEDNGKMAEIVGVQNIKVAGIDTDPDPSPNAGATKLREYWVHGKGAAKIRWGAHGDFNRCVTHLTKYVGTRAKGLCNVYHRSALGAPPGKGHGKSILERVEDIELKARQSDPGGSSSDTRPAAKKAPAKKAPKNSDFEGKHPRGTGGKFTFKNDTGKGDAERGTKDPNAAPDGKVHGRIGRAQAGLVKLGFLDKKAGEKGNAVDGKFGANTQRAVLAFQKKYKLKPTGKLDAATQKALNDQLLKKAPAKKPTKKVSTKMFEIKRTYSASERSKMAESGEAMKDGSFPIKDAADLRNAIASYGRASDPEAAKAHIRKRAKDLGKEDLLPASWGGKSYFEFKSVGSTHELKAEGGTEVGAMEYKSVGVSGVKELGGENSGIVEAVVSVTGIKDNVNDIIKPGAYAKSLAIRTPKGVWHHNWHESVSRTEDIKEMLPGDADLPETLPNGQPWPAEAGALKVVTRFNLETQRGREAYADVKFFGAQQEWSIGYNVPVGGATIDSKTGIREIETLDLFEYSPVLFGAMPVARTASIKSAQEMFELMSKSFDPAELLMETKDFLNSLGEDDSVVEGEEKADKKKPAVAQEEEGLDDEMAPSDSEEDQGVQEEDPTETGEEDDMPVKKGGKRGSKAMMMSAPQVDLVKGCIDALQKLYDSFSAEETAPSEDTAEEKMRRRKRGGGSAACKSLEELVAKHFDDQDVIESAKAFDVAQDAQELKDMETAATAVLDAIEDAIDSGDETDFSDTTDYIVEAISEIEDSGEEDTSGSNEEDVTGGEETTTNKPEGKSVTLTMAEFKDMFGDMVRF